ncbi:O-antigen polysaccharide polymerase Wzy [bacterium]|nr:O-antigen polysaccharide polymerase Wzy [bacterium]
MNNSVLHGIENNNDMSTYDIITEPVEPWSHVRLREFCKDSLRIRSWAYIGWLLIAIGISWGVYMAWRGSPVASVQPSLFISFVVIAVHVIFRISSGGRANIMAPDILFLSFYTLFHLGYVALYGLGLMPYMELIFYYQTSIAKCMFIINLGLISFMIGYEFMGSKGSAPRQIGTMRIPGMSWYMLGFFFMFLAVTMHLFFIAYLGMDFITQHGHHAFQKIDEVSGSLFLTIFWRNTIQVMILGTVIYTVSSALIYNKLFKSKVALMFVIIYFILSVLEGERGNILLQCAPILLVRHYLVKRVSIRNLTWIAVAALFLFVALGPFIRMYSVFNPAKMAQEFQNQKSAGNITWTTPIVEMGSSYRTLSITANDVPSQEPYWRGASWLNAIFHIVPFLEGYALRQGWSRWGPAKWVTVTYWGTHAAGKGFTVAAEGYLNFGFLGVFIEMALFGVFLRWLTIKFSLNPSMKWALIMLACTGISITVIRNHSGVMLSPCARVIVVASILNLFLSDEPVPQYPTEMEMEMETPYEETAYAPSVG